MDDILARFLYIVVKILRRFYLVLFFTVTISSTHCIGMHGFFNVFTLFCFSLLQYHQHIVLVCMNSSTFLPCFVFHCYNIINTLYWYAWILQRFYLVLFFAVKISSTHFIGMYSFTFYWYVFLHLLLLSLIFVNITFTY